MNKLEAIKEIIFGEEKQNLDSQLEKLESRVDADVETIRSEIKLLHDSLSKQLTDLQQSLQDQMAQQEEAVKKEISRIDHEKTNRADLGDLLIALGNQLKS